MRDCEAATVRGAELLDLLLPGWADVLHRDDLAALDLGSTRTGTLGALFGSSDAGLAALFGNEDERGGWRIMRLLSTAFGFSAAFDERDALTHAWYLRIAERRTPEPNRRSALDGIACGRHGTLLRDCGIAEARLHAETI